MQRAALGTARNGDAQATQKNDAHIQKWQEQQQKSERSLWWTLKVRWN